MRFLATGLVIRTASVRGRGYSVSSRTAFNLIRGEEERAPTERCWTRLSGCPGRHHDGVRHLSDDETPPPAEGEGRADRLSATGRRCWQSFYARPIRTDE